MENKSPTPYGEFRYRYLLGNPMRIPYGSGEKYIELGGWCCFLMLLCSTAAIFPMGITLLEYKSISRILIYIFLLMLGLFIMKLAAYWIYRLKLHIMNKRGELL